VSREVWKYRVSHVSEGTPSISMPAGAQIVHADVQHPHTVWIWAIVDPRRDRELRSIAFFATGEPIPEGWEHRGTALDMHAGLVWHVFERP